MKILITVFISAFIIGFGIYSYIHLKREETLKQLKKGIINRNTVVEILGNPISIQPVDSSEISGNFNRYQRPSNESPRLKDNLEANCVTKEIYEGHRCLFFCPTYFEDKFIIYYDKEEIACKIERIGL